MRFEPTLAGSLAGRSFSTIANVWPAPLRPILRTCPVVSLAMLTWAALWPALLSAQGYPPEEGAKKLTTLPGWKADLLAAEPVVRQPILVKFDSRGRLWTLQYLQYPNPAGLTRVKVDRWSRTTYDRVPEPPPRGPRGVDVISILEDRDGDGRMEAARDVITGLNLATGLEFGHGGLYVMQAPYLLFYPDADRNDVPDRDPEVLLSGFGIEDAQSMPNHLTWGSDGWLYGVTGSTSTNTVRDVEFQQGVWRFHPITRAFELFSEGGSNLFGLTFDARGQLFFSSNGGQVCYHGVQGAYYEKSFGKHGSLHNLYAYGWFPEIKKLTPQLGGPTTGGTIYLGTSLADPLRGTFIGGDFLGHTVSYWKMQPRGSTYELTRGGTLLDPHDTWSGPTDIAYGPDGSIVISDFYDRRTAHPDPDANWDRSNGRIYRISMDGKALPVGLDLEALSSADLFPYLTHPNHWFRQRVLVILAARRDSSIWPDLQQLMVASPQPEDALAGLWGLHVSGGLTEDQCVECLTHAFPDVRAWAVRLLGERQQISQETGERLAALARSETALVVRSQLASSSQRFPSTSAVPILMGLVDQNQDAADPYIPWLIWWGLEKHAIAARQSILAAFNQPARLLAGMAFDQRAHLIRRYAAEGTSEGEQAVIALLAPINSPDQMPLWRALSQGLDERSAQVSRPGQGALFSNAAKGSEPSSRMVVPRGKVVVSPALQTVVREGWMRDPSAPVMRLLTLKLGLEGIEEELIQQVRDPAVTLPVREQSLEWLSRWGSERGMAALRSLFDMEQPENLTISLIPLLARTDDSQDMQKLLSLAGNGSPRVRSVARAALFSRPETAAMFLQQVAMGKVPLEDIPLDEIRRLSALDSPELQALIRSLWGSLSAGTPEEKLAEMRRINNDIRAGSGNGAAGKMLFMQHCAVCHSLYGEGKKVGPDLTNTSRADREFLLVSLVDPSAVIRKQYLTSVVLLQNGQTWNGLIAEQDAARLTLIDSRGERKTIQKSEIEEIVESSVSLMPENLIGKFSPQQVRDLFAYLQSPPEKSPAAKVSP